MSISWKKKPVLCLCALALCWNGGLTVAAADLSQVPEEVPQGTEDPPTLGGAVNPGGDTGTEDPPTLGGVANPDGDTGTEDSPTLGGVANPDGDTGTEDPPTLGSAVNPDEDAGPEEPAGESDTVMLDSRVIAEGETLSYTTISSAFAGKPVAEGYYPGELTIQLSGTVIVEAGGSLVVGTLSVGGQEASPVITGTGQIIVRAGGSLRLSSVVLEPQGSAPLIVQETGGSVEMQYTTVEDGVIQWAGPLVNNLYDSPHDVWLEVGTVLTGDMLPTVLNTALQKEGHEDDVEIPLSWDLGSYDGQTQGELVLLGTFLDESGQPLASLVPLEITVRWYTPGTLTVTDAQWKGSTVPTVQLTVQELPEDADVVWGEVSTDGGVTWTRWENEDDFFVVEIEPEGWACVFDLHDETPALFRVAAETAWWFDEYACWRSDAFALSPPEDGEDSGGNRGGSTTPDPPEREPEPAERPDPDREDPGADRDDAPSLTEPPIQNEEQPEGGAVQETPPDTPETELPESEPTYVREPEESPAEKPSIPAQESSASVPEPAQLTGPESGEKEDLVWKINDEPLETTPEQPTEQDTEPESQAPEPEEDPHPEELAQEELTQKKTDEPLPASAQVLLAAAGVAVCAVCGLATAGLGPFRKRK